MIPELVDIGSPWKVLPAGIHDASVDEVEHRFSTNDHRACLFDGLSRALGALRLAGCRTVYLDGSYVTGKPNPADFDGCWDTSGVDDSKLDRSLWASPDMRTAQKREYGGELFPAYWLASPQHFFIDFFQTDKYTNKRKGIIRIRL